MSAHSQSKPSAGPGSAPLTALSVSAAKGRKKISVLTAYDYPTAHLVDAGGADIVLVGDSLGMVVLGRKDTLGVTLDEMIYHTRAVVPAVNNALVVAYMPFMTYEPGVAEALANAGRLVRESGARAVKLEGGRLIAPQVKALVDAGIAVMGHIGLTPQRAAVLGGFVVQGKTAAQAEELLKDAKALQEAGCFSIVVEAVPAPVAKKITESIEIPTIGIGAGPHCDGQVLVLHDMLGLNPGHVPRFVKKYAQLAKAGEEAVREYIREVHSGEFPGKEHSFSMSEEELARLK